MFKKIGGESVSMLAFNQKSILILGIYFAFALQLLYSDVLALTPQSQWGWFILETVQMDILISNVGNSHKS